jgi:hypothetical protein
MLRKSKGFGKRALEKQIKNPDIRPGSFLEIVFLLLSAVIPLPCLF